MPLCNTSAWLHSNDSQINKSVCTHNAPMMFKVKKKRATKQSCPRRLEASVIDGPIQSAFVRGKGSGGGKKSRRPQYPLRHSGHGENRLESNINMEFCYTSDSSSTEDKLRCTWFRMY